MFSFKFELAFDENRRWFLRVPSTKYLLGDCKKL